MLKRTHLIFAAFAFIVANIWLKYPVLFMVFSLIGACIPDIDVKFKHRKLLHNIWVLALIVFVGMSFRIMNWDIAIALSIGFLSHLIADSLTHNGIMPLWPLTKPRIVGPVRTGGVSEYIIAISIIVIIAYILGIIRIAIPW